MTIRKAHPKAPANAREGIFYVVRLPSAWTLVTRPLKYDEGTSHYDWWESDVAGVLAIGWAKKLALPVARIMAEIKSLTYAFPRGRVSRTADGFVVLHGCDVTSSMRVPRRRVETAFGLEGRCEWLFDDHEQCQHDDKEAIRDYFGIDEAWSAV